MKISDIQVYPVQVPLLHEFKAAYGIRNTADFVLVKIECNCNLYGWGEASTIPIYDEGSQADVVFVINRYFKPLLMNEDPTNISYLIDRINKSVKGSRYAKCAIDFALHDLAGKIYGMPVYKMLGGNGHSLEVCWVLSAKAPEQIKNEAEEHLQKGYKCFKLKVGTNAERDIDNLAALRSIVGKDAEIRLDGNEAWSPKQALDLIEMFQPYHPCHIEQPVPAWNYEGLKFVKEHSKIPIVADECVLTPEDMIRVVKMDAADRINIKISRDGGIISSRKIAAIAQASGQTPFAGSNLELGLGTVASAHLFNAMPDLSMASELVGPLLLKEDILSSSVRYCNGHLLLNDKPGFGVEINMHSVNKYLVSI